jgi:hypothetical protein
MLGNSCYLFGEENNGGKSKGGKKYLIFCLEEMFEALSLSSQKQIIFGLSRNYKEGKSSLKL